MKPILTLLLFAAWGLTATAQDKPLVVATTSILQDITQTIAGAHLDVRSLVPIGGDPHLYEPIPQDAITITDADLILTNGLTLEGWLNEFIANAGTSARVVVTTEGITPIQSATYASSPDPHAWMDAQNGITYARNIAAALIALDPDHADAYQMALDAYVARLEEVDADIRAMIANIPEAQRVLITSHDAFQYFGRRYGLRLESILGTSTDAQAQTSDINRLYQVIQKQQVPAIFIESTINPQTMKQIAQDTKVSIGGKLFSDSLGPEDSPAATYVGMLLWNAKTIMDALSTENDLADATDETRPQGNSRTRWYLIITGLVLLIGAGLLYTFSKR